MNYLEQRDREVRIQTLELLVAGIHEGVERAQRQGTPDPAATDALLGFAAIMQEDIDAIKARR